MLTLPYDERRLIVIADRPLSPPQPKGRQTTRWREIVLRSPVMEAVPFVAAGVLGRELVAKVKGMRAQGAQVLPVSLSVAQGLRFPPGHPRSNVLYVAHPVDVGSYIPAAEFHRFLFEHKVAEAQRLIRSLGATRVNVRSVKGWNREAALNMGLSVPKSGNDARAGGDLGRTSGDTTEIITSMTLQPSLEPAVPDGLVWMAHEPLWQEVAEARLESGLREFSLDVRSTDDFGVNASLKALVEKVGFDAGGRFVDHVETIWRLDGLFDDPHSKT